ncbi:MAG: hypothetical protein GF353_25695 [Candidatus Lokiarchaeota archaeon]|nr:hypothetical protein [Candidatus Lokiarchaeota archaeon]
MNIVVRSSLHLELPSVQKVIEIAQEMVSENRVLNTENLYNLAKSRLQIPRKGLLRIIRFLINKKILVEGSKFTRGSVLDNAYRKRIYNFISSHLGVHFSIIKRVIFSETDNKSGSAGQLLWHLKMLIKFDYIKKVNFKKYTIFIPAELDEEIGIIFFLLRDKINKKIIDLLIHEGTIETSEVHKRIDETRELIYYRINDLIDNNLLSEIEEENKTISLSPDKKHVLVQIFKRSINMKKNKI